MQYETPEVEVVEDENIRARKSSFNLKLVKLGWALFFISVGSIWISENLGRIGADEQWPLIYLSIGCILLGLNIVRLFTSINPSKFTTGIGIIALVVGIGEFYHIGNFSKIAVALVVIGLFMILEIIRK